MTAKPKRRWYQFSLLGMLVVLTLVCVALGWVANERMRLARRKLAIERIEAVGGSVEFDWEWERPTAGPYFSNGLPELIYGDDNARAEVVLVSFLDEQASPTDEDVALVAQFPHLKMLFIAATTNSEKVLDTISQLPELETLSLTAVKVSPASVRRLAPLQKLRRLRLKTYGETEDDIYRQVRETLPNCSLDEYSPFP